MDMDMDMEEAHGEGASPYDILEDLLSGYDDDDATDATDAAEPEPAGSPEEGEDEELQPELGASPPGDEFATLAAVLGDAAPEVQPEPQQPEPPAADDSSLRLGQAAETEVADEAAAIEEQLSDDEVRRMVLDKSVDDWCRTELGAAHAVPCLAALQQALVETVGDALFLLPSAAAVRAELQLPAGAGVALWDALGPYAEMMASSAESEAPPAGEGPEQAPGERAGQVLVQYKGKGKFHEVWLSVRPGLMEFRDGGPAGELLRTAEIGGGAVSTPKKQRKGREYAFRVDLAAKWKDSKKDSKYVISVETQESLERWTESVTYSTAVRAASASAAASRRAQIEQRLSDEEAAQVLRDEQKRRVEWLSRVPIFRAEGVDGNNAFMEDLARKLEGRTLRTGVMIIEKGTIGNEMFFVARGEAEVLADYDAEATPSLDANHAPSSRLGTLGEGAFCGEGALLEDERRNAYVVVKSSTVKLLALSRNDLQAVLHSHPEVEKAIRQLMDERRKTRNELQLAETETETAAGPEDETASGDAAVPVKVSVQAEAQEPTEVMYDSTRLNPEGGEQPNEDRTGTTDGDQDDVSARLEAAWSGLEAAVEGEEETEEEQKQEDVRADSGSTSTAGRGTRNEEVAHNRHQSGSVEMVSSRPCTHSLLHAHCLPTGC
jgi:CRP-like cAMP-binding protein